MALVIALTQFAFIALGTLALNILVKTSGNSAYLGTASGGLAGFLVTSGVWLLLVPVVWLLLAALLRRLGRPDAGAGIIQAVGIAVSALIFVVYTYAVLTFQ